MTPHARSAHRFLAPVLAFLAVSGAAVALAACGHDDAPSRPKLTPEQQVGATWRTAAVAAATGNGDSFCPRLTTDARAQITAATKLPCADAIRLLGSRLTPADRKAIAEAPLTAVTITGDTAVVRYKPVSSLSPLGFTGRTTLQQVGGRWLLSGT
jgi:hypothetical protein